MDIKGKFKYVEPTPQNVIEKDVFNLGNTYIDIRETIPVTESQYYKNNSDILFAFKPLHSKEEIKQNFLEQLRELIFFDESLISYINNIESEKLVNLYYFDVFFCKIFNATFENKSYETRYRKTGEYTMKTDDGKTYDISPKYESYKALNTTSYTKDLNNLAYCSRYDKAYYNTDEVDESRLVEIKDFNKLNYFESKNYKYVAEQEIKAKKIHELQLIQVLLFPIWKIEFEFDGKKYYTYISDVSGKMVIEKLIKDTIPKTTLPILLTDPIKKLINKKEFACGFRRNMSFILYIVDIIALVVYFVMGIQHCNDTDKSSWSIIHSSIFITAITFGGLFLKNEGKSIYVYNKYLDTYNYKRQFFYMLLATFFIALGISLTIIFKVK